MVVNKNKRGKAKSAPQPVVEQVTAVKEVVADEPKRGAKFWATVRKLVVFLYKAGLWKYVKQYYSKVVSTTAIGGIIALMFGQLQVNSPQVAALQATIDSLEQVAIKQDSIFSNTVGLYKDVLFIEYSPSDTIK